MGKRDIRRAVMAKIALGYSRQHAFDEMRLEQPTIGVERLADVVRYTPSLAARQRYRIEQGALLGAIAAAALLQFIHAPMIFPDHAIDTKTLLMAIPLGTIILGAGVARYHVQLYRWLALLSLYGIFRRMGIDELDRPDLWTIAHYVLTISIAGLAFFLNMKLASKYSVVPGTTPPQVIFPPEPGSSAM